MSYSYNEKAYDLLEPKDAELQIREDASHNIVIPGLTEVCVHGCPLLVEFITSYKCMYIHTDTALES
jgi:hypothetical protein